MVQLLGKRNDEMEMLSNLTRKYAAARDQIIGNLR